MEQTSFPVLFPKSHYMYPSQIIIEIVDPHVVASEFS